MPFDLTTTNLTGVMTTGASDAAIQLTALAGGVGIRSTAGLEGSIQIETDGGANETISIKSHQGTGVNAAGGTTDASINLISDDGGIGLKSGVSADNAIRIEANGGVNETIVIHANQGTGEGTSNASVQLLSDVGGIDLTATGLTGVMTDGNSDAAVQLSALAGGVGIRSTANLAGSIQIEADGGTAETIIIKSDQGTSATSIHLLSDVGGITITGDADHGVVVGSKLDVATLGVAVAKTAGTVDLGTNNNGGGNGTTTSDQNARAGTITVTLGAAMANNSSGFFNLRSSKFTSSDVIMVTTSGKYSENSAVDLAVYGVDTDFEDAGFPAVSIYIKNYTGSTIADDATIVLNYVAI